MGDIKDTWSENGCINGKAKTEMEKSRYDLKTNLDRDVRSMFWLLFIQFNTKQITVLDTKNLKF